MCGRFSNSTSSDDVKAVFKLSFPSSGGSRGHNNRPQWNIAPSMMVDTVVNFGQRRHLTAMTWGIATPQNTRPLINARSETMFEKPTFRQSARMRRCLVIASGWFEWAAPKKPYFIRRADDAPMGMAGLYWDDAIDGGRHCVIVTTAADRELSAIHHRAPMVLDPQHFGDWLNPETSLDAVANLTRPTLDSVFQWHPVSAEVGSTRVDHDQLVVRDDNHGITPEPQLSLF